MQPVAHARLIAVALTDRERAILDFEATWWLSDVPKDVAIADRFDLDAVEYEDVLAELVTRADAAEHDPLVVARVRRWRERQRRGRREGAHA
jgi:hypothetical protein